MSIDMVIKQIEKSPIWEDLNNRCKALYEEHNRTPSEEEYQALRNMLICKVMLEDEQVYEAMVKYTYETLRAK